MRKEACFILSCLEIVEMRVVASLKWCPIRERTVYSSYTEEGFEERGSWEEVSNLKIMGALGRGWGLVLYFRAWE